jgi:hypothetical protein
VRKLHAVRVIAVADPAGKPPGAIPIIAFLPFIAVAAQGQEQSRIFRLIRHIHMRVFRIWAPLV